MGHSDTALHCARPILHFRSRIAWSILDCAGSASRRTACSSSPTSLVRGRPVWSSHCARSTRDSDSTSLSRGGPEATLNYAHRASTLKWSLQACQPSPLEGGLFDLPLRAAFSPAHPLARRDVPLPQTRAFRFSPCCPMGNSRTILHCAHRTSTVSSCAFCEQEGWSGCSPLSSIRTTSSPLP